MDITSETGFAQVPADPVAPVTGATSPVAFDNILDGYNKRNTPTGNNNITVFRYPEELGADEQYPHYMMFYINVREDAAAGQKSTKRRTDTQGDLTGQMRIDPANAGGAVGVAAATSIGFAAAKQGAKTLTDQLTGRTPPSAKVMAQVIGGVGGGLAGGAAAGGLGYLYGNMESRPLVKITDVIALHINNPPSVAYKANWSESDMGVAGAVGSGRIEDHKLDAMVGYGDLLLRAGAAGMPKAAGGPNVKDVMEAASKKVANPYKEQLFKSMGMRTFAYDYTFLPKSPREAKNVLNIIRLFKRNMHPEIDKTKLFLVYPAEFSIVYYYKTEENSFLNKISSCVLTDLSVKFGGGSNEDFTTFKGGFPTMISIRLQFLELEMLTGERVDNDLNYDTGTTFGY